MQKLSLREFKNTCDSLSFNKFTFFSENQSWDKVGHTIKVKMTFKIALIAFNPNIICFKDADNYLCLNRVKCIKMKEENSMIGRVFTIVCGDFSNADNDISYTIIAQ